MRVLTTTTKHLASKAVCAQVWLWRFQPFIPQPRLKLAVSTLASIPLLREGFFELFREGLTSKVLEAMAVGVSLARRDYSAANSTNLMLEIGEYIEETTVHKSDDLIKELAKTKHRRGVDRS